MKPEELRKRIHEAAMFFAQEIATLLCEYLSSMAKDLSVKSSGTTKVSRKKTRRPNKTRVRRSKDQLDQTGETVLTLLGKNPSGLRIEAINKQLGTTTRELMRPVQKLVQAGLLRKEGYRRTTTYFVA